jgi:hypothetical protein
MAMSVSSASIEGPYRDSLFAARQRLSAVLTRRERMLARVEPLPKQLLRRRIARSVAGGVGIAAGLLMFLTPLVTYLIGLEKPGWLVVGWLFAAPPLALLGYQLGWVAGRGHTSTCMHEGMALSDDAVADLERLEHTPPPAELLIDAAARWERRSVGLPLAAAALLLPLALHLTVYALFFDRFNVNDFAVWITISGVVVGHVHLTLAVLAWRYVGKASRGRAEAADLWRVWWVSALISLVPGVVMMAIPPILVAVTGLAYLPLLVWARRLLEAERLQLGAARARAAA